MRDLNDGRAFGVKFLKQLHDLFALARVKISSRFVRQNQFRIGNDRARDTDELLLAAGQLARKQIFFGHDLKTIERVRHNRRSLVLADFSIRKRDLEIFVNRQIVEQMILLENETDLFVAQRRPALSLSNDERPYR